MDDAALDVLSLREALGESQAVFAERFGVDQATVHRWEKRGLPKRGTARRALERFKAQLELRAVQ